MPGAGIPSHDHIHILVLKEEYEDQHNTFPFFSKCHKKAYVRNKRYDLGHKMNSFAPHFGL